VVGEPYCLAGTVRHGEEVAAVGREAQTKAQCTGPATQHRNSGWDIMSMDIACMWKQCLHAMRGNSTGTLVNSILIGSSTTRPLYDVFVKLQSMLVMRFEVISL
jgi:hypothetical protein